MLSVSAILSGRHGCCRKTRANQLSAARLNAVLTLSIPPICTPTASAKRSSGVAGQILFDERELVLSTKAFGVTGPSVNERGLSRKHLFDAIDLSLRRLKTDNVDIYQLHRADHTTPIEESLEAMHDIVKSGKARYVGVSNMAAWQLMRTLAICDKRGWVRPIAIQNHYNLAYREEEREMLPLCALEGVGVTPWSPLARGFLAGNSPRDGTKSKRATADPNIKTYFSEVYDYAVLDEVKACAERNATTMTRVALAWLLAKQTVSAPIIGATKISHVDDAVGTLKMKLSPVDIEALERPYRPHPVFLHL